MTYKLQIDYKKKQAPFHSTGIKPELSGWVRDKEGAKGGQPNLDKCREVDRHYVSRQPALLGGQV